MAPDDSTSTPRPFLVRDAPERPRRARRALAAALVLATGLATGLGVATATTATSATSAVVTTMTSTNPCGATRAATPTHVVWIMLENVGYSVVGSPGAPYLNTLIRHCALATNDAGVAHPSLPNYIALTSGSTQGITDDNEPSSHPLGVASIFSQLKGDWRTYAESMPVACDRVTSGQYAARHNPAVYFTNLPTCARDDVPLRTPLNLAAAFTMIVPNVCNDMHSCSVATGDAWLKKYVALIVQSRQYQSRSVVLFITFDENTQSSTNRIPTVVVGPSVPRGLRVATRFTHYSLLRTTEALLHVPALGAARGAPAMTTAFHL